MTGNTPDKTLTHVDQLTAQLNKTFDDHQQIYLSMNAFVPSLANQHLNFTLNKKFVFCRLRF